MATTADQRSKPDGHRLLPAPSTPFSIPRKCANRSVHRHFGDRPPPSLPSDGMTIGENTAPAAFVGDEDRGLVELRAKLMGHLREAADRMKVAVAGAPPAAAPPPPPPSSTVPAETAAAAERPWNLRTRRKPPTFRSSPKASPTPAPAAMERVQRNTRSRSEAAAAEEKAAAEEEGKRKLPLPKVTISLTAEEIEEDIYAISGSRPRRRPKKRPRAVQRHLDMVFPGLWLSDITEESYKVVEDE